MGIVFPVSLSWTVHCANLLLTHPPTGVIWHGDHLIDGVLDVLKFLRSKGKTVIFVT